MYYHYGKCDINNAVLYSVFFFRLEIVVFVFFSRVAAVIIGLHVCSGGEADLMALRFDTVKNLLH